MPLLTRRIPVNASHAAGDGRPVRVDVVSPGYWRITFDNPPINLFDPDVFAALRLLLDKAENDDDVRVLVFDSADPDYYISHLDVDRVSEVPEIPGAANLADEWHHFVTRLACSPVLSIASVRGRVRGIGTEFVLACDMRFASAETAILAQPEVGFGVVPGGGGLDWLPRLTGRSRALEIIAGAQDFDAGTAERYGWINRALPDRELDAFVSALATRIGGFERRALATAKRLVNQRSGPPSEGELLQSFKTILEAIAWPEAHARIAAMRDKGWGQRTEAELNHPYYLGSLGAAAQTPAQEPARS
jgi:enoyl-CoA hydratase/carnithine racemase